MTVPKALYAAWWETEAARKEQQVALNQTRLSRLLWSVGKSTQQEERLRPDRPALKRLVGARPSTGSLGCP